MCDPQVTPHLLGIAEGSTNKMGHDVDRGSRVVVKGREFLVRVLKARGRSATAHLRGNVMTVRKPSSVGPEDFFTAYTDLKSRMLKSLERWSEEALDRLLISGHR